MRTAAEQLALARDGVTCVRCGRSVEGRQASLHHRKLRGRKVPPREYDLAENLVLLCGSGTSGCHGWAHHNRREAARTGWVVWSWDDPAAIPIETLCGDLIMLRADGSTERHSLDIPEWRTV